MSMVELGKWGVQAWMLTTILLLEAALYSWP